MKILYDLDSTQIHPFILFLLSEFSNNIGKFNLLVDCLDLLIKFFVRRNLTNIPQARDVRAMSQYLINSISNKIEDISNEEIYNLLLEKTSKETCSNNIFKDALYSDLYDKHYRTARRILITLELSEKPNSKEIHKDFEIYDQEKKKYAWEIEHIFPKGENIPNHWVNMVNGKKEVETPTHVEKNKSDEIQNRLVHNIGNLTLTGYNPEMSNFSFYQKKKILNPNLFLNEYLFSIDFWDESTIKTRRDILIEKTVQLFDITAPSNNEND